VIPQITKTTTRVDLSSRESARRHVAGHHWIARPRLLDGDLLTHAHDVIASATFVEVRHDAVTPPSVDILFRVESSLQHRATAVTRGVKPASAGWFRSADPRGDAWRGSRR
jgi:hypothetical protein